VSRVLKYLSDLKVVNFFFGFQEKEQRVKEQEKRTAELLKQQKKEERENRRLLMEKRRKETVFERDSSEIYQQVNSGDAVDSDRKSSSNVPSCFDIKV